LSDGHDVNRESEHLMSITTIGPGGIPTGSGSSTIANRLVVLHDDTLTGQGNEESLLSVAGGGSVSVAVDGTSIGGNGKTATPLHTITGGVAVDTDNVTAQGNGTTASKIAIKAVQIASATHDPADLTGTGAVGGGLALVLPVKAACNVVRTGGSTLLDHAQGITSITRTGTGVVQCFYSPFIPGTDDQLVPLAIPQGLSAVEISVQTSQTPSRNITVSTFDSTGAPLDASFYLALLYMTV
jgi:hypothetical protein